MIIDHYSRMIYNLALNFFGNRDDASDITQDIFLKIYRHIDKYKAEKNFQAWVLKIAKNHCIDSWRRRKKIVIDREVEDPDYRDDRTPELKMVQKSDILMLREKIRHLDPDLRTLLILRDIQEFSYNEIAENLDLPLGTVKSRINRARIRLAKTFLTEVN